MYISLKVINIALILGVFISIPTSAEVIQLGKLFTSPAQRETLNRVREQYQRGLYKAGEKGGEPQSYKFNGLVSKNGKAKILWVNGSSMAPDKTRSNGLGQYQIDLPPGPVKLKPGQAYQPTSASVVEAFNAGGASEQP